MAGNIPEWKLFHFFIVKSIQAAFKRGCSLAENQSSVELKHPLAILAHELKQVAEKEYTAFYPVLCQKYPNSGKLAFILLHLLYGERLKPFLEGLTHLSESAKEVLAASNTLELCLAHKLSSIYGDNVDSSTTKYVHPYQISHYCAPLVLQWIHAQHDNILEWTKRAVEIEDLFIANGQGLPFDVVEKEARLARQILDLFALKADNIIEMLISASEQAFYRLKPTSGRSGANDAQTLLRVLCHKKDGSASEFLKMHYQLPKSSDYDDIPSMEERTSTSPILSNIFGGTSSYWGKTGQRSFKVMKKKFQEAKFEIRTPW